MLQGRSMADAAEATCEKAAALAPGDARRSSTWRACAELE